MGIAVKSFIINNGKLLIIRRADNDGYMAGIWEIPGGKLDDGEDIISGLKREVKEETGIDIEVIQEISVRYFIRHDNNMKIEMHIFLSRAVNTNVKLSEEHSAYEWIDVLKCKEKISEFYHPEVEKIIKIVDGKKI